MLAIKIAAVLNRKSGIFKGKVPCCKKIKMGAHAPILNDVYWGKIFGLNLGPSPQQHNFDP